MTSQPKPSKGAGSTPGDRRQMGAETKPRQLRGSTMTLYTDQPENDYTSACGRRKGITWLSSKVNQIRLPLPGRVILASKMSHLGLPDQCDTADNTDVPSREYGNSSTASSMEASSTERLTSDVPVTNEYDKTYTPCTARQAFEPMAHSGQNNAVPAMCNMTLTTSKINMQVHHEESSEGEDFGYPSDAEWQSKDTPSPIRKGDLEGLDDLRLRPSPLELNSCKATCLEDKIHPY